MIKKVSFAIILGSVMINFSSCDDKQMQSQIEKILATNQSSAKMIETLEKRLPNGTPIEYPKAEVSDQVKMISIPAGKFINDDGEEITVADFKISQTEITQAQWRKVMNNNGFSKEKEEHPNAREGLGDDLPMYYVAFVDAVIFCNELSKKEGKTPCYYYGDKKTTDYKQWKKDSLFYIEYKYNEDTGEREKEIFHENLKINDFADGYRLPTKNEFEYATRGGEDFAFAGSDSIEFVAWKYWNNNGRVHKVGTLRPNGFGLYDMIGNVDEWCWDELEKSNGELNHYTYNDYYNAYHYPKFDFQGFRVVLN